MHDRRIKIDLSDREYMIRFSWPDHTHVQCRDNCKIPDEPELTKSFEVFDNGFYFAGFAEYISDAEKFAWDFYQKFSECGHHILNKERDEVTICSMCGAIKVIESIKEDSFLYDA